MRLYLVGQPLNTQLFELLHQLCIYRELTIQRKIAKAERAWIESIYILICFYYFLNQSAEI